MKKDNLIYWIIGLGIALLIFMNKKSIVGYVEEKITGINNTYDAIFKKIGSKLNISARVLKSIAANESSVGLAKTVEPIGNTKGIMHVIYDTAVRFSPGLKEGEHKNLPPEKDIEIGSTYFQFLLKKYGVLEHAVKAYNGGEGRMSQILAYQKSNVFKPVRTGDTLEKMNNAHANMTSYWQRFNRNFKLIS